VKEDSDPSFSQELAGLAEWDRAFWLSRAFLEASRCLCESMSEGGFSSQHSSSRVILHLARQGVELFLKGAIAAVSGQGGVSEFLCARQIKTCRLAGRELHSTNDSS